MRIKIVIAVLLLLTTSGCIIAGGYSPERGWFIWPGSILLFVVGLILFLFVVRRRR